MTLEFTLNFLAFAALVAVEVVPLFIATRVRISSLRALSLLLGLFAVFHGAYHLAEAFQVDLLADLVLEPLSVVFLLTFGVYYSKKGVL